MVRELLRRSLGMVSPRPSADADRLSTLERRISNLEELLTEKSQYFDHRVNDIQATVSEWAGVEGYSHRE